MNRLEVQTYLRQNGIFVMISRDETFGLVYLEAMAAGCITIASKDEGFDEISRLFANIVEIEKRHSHRFETLAGLLKEGALFKKEEVTQWVYRKCGHTQIGKEAPCKCPVCDHPQGYFELFVEKF